MTALSMPTVDQATVDEIKKRMPDLSAMELPKLENVGKTAEETIDRLLGRKRAPIWPWFAAALGLAAAIGIIAAYLAWLRKPAMPPVNDAWTTEPVTTPDVVAVNEEV